MTSENISVLVTGRFPPPIDGQSIITKRVADLLSQTFDVATYNTSTIESSRIAKIRHYLANQRGLVQVVRSHRPDVMVWTTISPHFDGHLRDKLMTLRSAQETRTIAVVHWGNFDALFQSTLLRKSANALVDKLHRVVFNDDLLADKCSRWIPQSKICIMPNVIDANGVSTDSEVNIRRRNRPYVPFRILYLSNMIESKGYLDVLVAGKLLKDRGFNISLQFAGAWHDSPDKFYSNVKQLELDNEVVHHGLLSDRRLINELHLSADAFVLPTYYPTEAQPSSIIEAMSAATPIITCDQGGISGILRPNIDAAFVPPKNPEKIAEAVVNLHDPEVWKMYSTRSRDRFMAKFDLGLLSSKWSSLIKSVAAEPVVNLR